MKVSILSLLKGQVSGSKGWPHKRGSIVFVYVSTLYVHNDRFIFLTQEDDSGYVCIACVALLRRAYRQNTQHATLPSTSREKKNTIKLSTLERKPNITMKPIPKKEPNTTKQSSSTVKRDTTMHSTPIKKPNTTMQSAPTEELDTSMESSAVEMNTTMQSASSDEIDSTMQTMPREEPDTLLQSTPESTNEITGETINVPKSPQRTSPIGPQKKGTNVSFLYLTDLAKAAPVIKKPAKVRPSQCFIKRHLSRGRYGAGIKGILKKGEPAKVAFREVLKNIVKTEIRTYMNIASFPELNDSSSLEDVGWSEIIKDMTATMPTIMDVMEAIMPQRTAPNKKYAFSVLFIFMQYNYWNICFGFQNRINVPYICPNHAITYVPCTKHHWYKGIAKIYPYIFIAFKNSILWSQ